MHFMVGFSVREALLVRNNFQGKSDFNTYGSIGDRRMASTFLQCDARTVLYFNYIGNT